jgi:chromosome partitioning protein
MRKIGILSTKGGVGKTTLTVHLAVAAAERGMKVVIFDTDKEQLSAVAWSESRGKKDPLVIELDPSKLASALAAAAADGFDLVLVDTAPNTGPDAVDVARLIDKAIIPIRPSAFDIKAVGKTVALVLRESVPSLVVLSACPLRAPEIAMARTSLSKSGVPVAITEIGDRRSFARAVMTGRSVSEFEPEGKATAEINALLEEILK